MNFHPVKWLASGLRWLSESLISDLRNPALWLQNWGGRKSSAGLVVNGATALTASAVFACVRAIAEDVGKLPYILYRRTPDGGKERAIDDPLFALLHDEPNPEMTAISFRTAVTGTAVLFGNGYAEIERNGRGEVIALWPLHPDRVTIERDDEGLLFYRVRSRFEQGVTGALSMKEVAIPAVDMLHIVGFTPNGIAGYMITQVGKEAIGLAMAIERFGASFFGSGAEPGIVLTHPGTLSDPAIERMRQSWNTAHQGLDNAHKVAILEEDVKIEKTSFHPKESQAIEARQFQLNEIARYFRMPPHKIQDLLRATFSNIEEQSLAYLTDTLMPWLVRWEQETKRKVIRPVDRQSLFAEHLVDAILRADTKTRSESNQIQLMNGALTVNEWRAMENRNPLDGDEGDVHYVQMNLAPVGSVPAQAEEAAAPVFLEAVQRVLRKEISALTRASGKHDDPKAFASWVLDFYSGHAAYVREAIAVPCRAFGAMMSIPRSAVDGVITGYVQGHIERSRREAIEADAIGELKSRWLGARAEHIPGELMKAICSTRKPHAEQN